MTETQRRYEALRSEARHVVNDLAVAAAWYISETIKDHFPTARTAMVGYKDGLFFLTDVSDESGQTLADIDDIENEHADLHTLPWEDYYHDADETFWSATFTVLPS